MVVELNTDVVIAGAGGTGLSAANAVVSNGLKTIVIEKLPQIGGNTKISSGFFAVDTKEQRAEGLHLSTEEAIRQLNEYNHYLNNGPLTRRIVENAKPTLESIEELGMEIKLNPTSQTTQFAHLDNPYAGGSYHMYQNKDASYDRIQKSLEDKGVEFIFNTTMTKLIQAPDGQVQGLVAKDDQGETLQINAKAVVVATGGFGANEEWIEKVMHTNRMRSLGVPSKGEGMAAMFKAGGTMIDAHALIHAAQLAKSKVTQKTSSKHLAGFSDNPLTRVLLTPLMWVDPEGRRFTNEDTVYDTVLWANAGYNVGGMYYILVDTKTLNEYTAGHELKVSKAGPGATDAKGDFVALAEQSVQEETAFKGATLAELAQNAGFDYQELKESVERYNEAVRTQNDTEFAKPQASLKYPVEKGPFYAIKAQVAFLGTVGGMRVDDHLRVLNKDFKPIKGLYAGGANAGGYYEGQSYPAYEGLASGFSWTSGRLAGLAIVEDLK
ncbi:FAD-dependent oxidoreductase [uncultured Limosilactobacillus sp.]|uniref:FAD-dependent oxidoreductase n=1 Tax=uncultured Limosilactobacillus sp. TaxID=2837629 RepID=UPI0025CEB57C|nr:FAD-dependent oxidoreductase [uncultured Limosilactobacillus sp.]